MANKRTILLVDDHPLVRSGIRAMLDGNYTICGESDDGEQAIEMARDLKPDLVMMDVSMPGIGGLEATRVIRSLLPDTKILILSMHDSPQVAASAKGVGADEMMTKTSTARDIIAAIDRLLGR